MKIFLTGSFFVDQDKGAEEKNAENFLIIKGNKPLVEAYIRKFGEHKGHSVVYVGKMSR